MKHTARTAALILLTLVSSPPGDVAEAPELEAPQPAVEQALESSPGPVAGSVQPQPSIVLYDAVPSQEALVEWALHRFEEAGLDLPRVEIFFYPDQTRCKGKDGLYFPGEQKLLFCSPSDALSMRQKGTLLHELAHAWADHMLTDEQRRAFMELRGVETWNSHQVEWHERGAEHAAEIVKWGIIDEPIWIVLIPDADCQSLEAGYKQLTGGLPTHLRVEDCT